MKNEKRFTKFFFGIALALSFLLIIKTSDVQASHFRGGSLTWAVALGDSVEFRLNSTFSLEEFGSPAVGDVFTEFIGGTALAFGDGTFTPTLQYIITYIDVGNNWLEATALEPGSLTDTLIGHMYPSSDNAGVPWEAVAGSCCRSFSDVNNSNGNYRLLTYVETASGNTPPTNTTDLWRTVPISSSISFFVTATDPDAFSTLRFRLATAAEAGFGFTQPAGIAVDNITGEVTWDNTGIAQGGNYSCQVIVEDSNVTTGDLLTQVAVDFHMMVPSDSCQYAIPVFCGSVVDGSTTDATSDDLGTCGSFNPGFGVWYKWVGTDGTATVSTCGGVTDFDTEVSVFSGTCGSLTCIGFNDDAACSGGTGFESTFTFVSNPGTDYYILVHGFGAGTGHFTLSMSCLQGPDLCEEAIPVNCGDVIDGTTLSATFDATAFCVTSNTTAGVWYKFSGNNATVTATTCGGITDYDTKISVYSGSCGALACVTGNDDMGGACPSSALSSSVTFSALSGVDYYILVHGFSTSMGNFTLSIDCVPDNDDCADYISIACDDIVNGTTVGATNDFAGDCGEANESAGVWYAFAGINKNVTVTTCGGITNFDTQISVFEGTCGALSCIDGDDDGGCGSSSEVTFFTSVGTDYFVLVHNFGSVGGDFTLSMTCFCDITATATATSDYNSYNVSCYNGSDGTAEATSPDGTGPFTFEWSDGQTTSPATGLSADTYGVTVTDVNGCTGTAEVTLSEPPKFEITVEATSDYNGYDIQCFGGSNGEATATPSNGVGSITYDWGGGITGNPATGLSATTYTVTATDANGCTATASVTLTEPPQMTVDLGPNQIVYNGYPPLACTNLTAEGAGGGVPPYTYEWSSDPSPLATIEVCPVTSTVYYVTLTDQNGCTVVDSVKVCAIDVRCGHDLKKVAICHETGSGPQTLCVALTGAKNHLLNHPGDELAACGTLKICSFTPPSAKSDESVSYFLEREMYEGKTWLGAIPNPFMDETAIRFILPADDYVNLKVFDVTGKIVANLFEGRVSSGNLYEETFDGSNFMNGIYFLTLTNSKGERFSEKLVLAR